MWSFLESYQGVITGLLAALCTGLAFTLYKQASDEIGVLALNFVQLGLGSIFFVLSVILLNKFGILMAVTWRISFFLILSVIFNILIADTLYFRAQQLIGVSKAFPIVNMAPIFTLFFAHYLLGEPLTERLFGGVVFVLSGVYLAARPRGKHTQSADTDETLLSQQLPIGVILALAATLSWTSGTICLRVGIIDTDIFVTGAIRYGTGTLCMFPIYAITGDTRRLIPKSRHVLYYIVIGAVMNIILGGLFFFTSIKELGASRSSTIIATIPLFGVGFSKVLYQEHITWKTILGTFMTIFGIWLIV